MDSDKFTYYLNGKRMIYSYLMGGWFPSGSVCTTPYDFYKEEWKEWMEKYGDKEDDQTQVPCETNDSK